MHDASCHLKADMNYIFLRLTKALLHPVFPVIAMQRFDFKNSIIAIQLVLVMILNQNCLKVKRGTKV